MQARRTRTYSSTLYILHTFHRVASNSIEGGGWSSFAAPLPNAHTRLAGPLLPRPLQLDRIWRYIATRDDVDVAKTSARMAEYQDRQERLEEAAANAREVLARHRSTLGNAGEIAEYAREMDDFLDRSEVTERRAFIEALVREIVVMPRIALLRYTVPMPDDSPVPGKVTERVALDGSELPAICSGKD